MIELFKDGDHMGIRTDCCDAGKFSDELARAFDGLVETKRFDGDWLFQFERWLPLAFEIWAKLRGYKADVVEQRQIYAGNILPRDAVEVVDDRGNITFNDGDAESRAEAVVAGIDAAIGSEKKR